MAAAADRDDAPPPPATLRCAECGAAATGDDVQYCEECFGPVELRVDWPALKGTITRADVDAGRGMRRWSALLPVEPLGGADVGDVPLVHAQELGRALGLDGLWLLDETAQPSGSYKDRVVSTALGEARRRGQRVAACASTGNLARSLAQRARDAQMRAVVLVPEDLAPWRLEDLVSTGATVVAVRGGYDAANRLATEAAAMRTDWAWVNATLRPWYVQGARTAGWEIARGLDWRLPDAFVAPIASGSYLALVHESLEVLAAVGLVSPGTVRLYGAQPEGCAPVARAFASGAATVAPVRPSTIATSLAMGDPPEGDRLLHTARATGGAIVAVAEDEILEAVALLEATEGIRAEPAGGVVVRALAMLAAEGALGRAETVVAAITGAAAPEFAEASAEASAGVVAPTATIEPTLEALEAILDE